VLYIQFWSWLGTAPLLFRLPPCPHVSSTIMPHHISNPCLLHPLQAALWPNPSKLGRVASQTQLVDVTRAIWCQHESHMRHQKQHCQVVMRSACMSYSPTGFHCWFGVSNLFKHCCKASTHMCLLCARFYKICDQTSLQRLHVL